MSLPKLTEASHILRTEIVNILEVGGETRNQWAIETLRDENNNETRIVLTPLGPHWRPGDSLFGNSIDIDFIEARAIAVGLLRSIYHEMPQTWYLAEGDPQEYLAHLLEIIYDLTPRSPEFTDKRDGVKNLLAMVDVYKRALSEIGKAKARALQWRRRYVNAAKWARSNHRKIVAQRRDIRGLRDKLKNNKDSYLRLIRLERAAKLYLEHGEPELADELEEILKESGNA